MADAKAYKELSIPKGGAKSFFEALTAQNDGNAPKKKRKTETSAKPKTTKKK